MKKMLMKLADQKIIINISKSRGVSMLGYIKEKTSNEELYETDYLTNIKNKKTKFAKLQYLLCFTFYELIVKIKYLFNLITVKKIYDAYIFILPFGQFTRQKISCKTKKMYEKSKKTN